MDPDEWTQLPTGTQPAGTFPTPSWEDGIEHGPLATPEMVSAEALTSTFDPPPLSPEEWRQAVARIPAVANVGKP